MAMKRKPLRDTIAANERAIRGLCFAAGKPIPAGFEERATVAKPTRAAPKPTDPTQLESAVGREIAEVLARHPKVLFALRINSGSAEIGGVPIWFWTWARRRGVEMTVTDYIGCMTDGKWFAIEAKARSWKVSSGDGDKANRERKQQAFINVVISAGGVGGFATSGERALEILG